MIVLVLGSKGQLGSELYQLQNDHSNFSFVFHDKDTLDLEDFNETEKAFQQIRPDVIINCAAYTAVDKAEDEADAALLVNAQIPAFIAKIAEKSNAKVIHVSTDYVFNGKNFIPYKESDPIAPNSVYGKTKAEGEKKVLQYTQSIVIRTSWLYSSFGNNFVKTILRLAAERDELNVVFDQIGTPTYARDLAQAILAVCDHFKNNDFDFKNRIFHYSNEGVCSWYDFAKEIVTLKNITCKIMPVESHQFPVKAKRPHYSVLNKALVKSTFNIEIPYWKDSLKDCLRLI